MNRRRRFRTPAPAAKVWHTGTPKGRGQPGNLWALEGLRASVGKVADLAAAQPYDRAPTPLQSQPAGRGRTAWSGHVPNPTGVDFGARVSLVIWRGCAWLRWSSARTFLSRPHNGEQRHDDGGWQLAADRCTELSFVETRYCEAISMGAAVGLAEFVRPLAHGRSHAHVLAGRPALCRRSTFPGVAAGVELMTPTGSSPIEWRLPFHSLV
jgi:hypothetical protein